MTTPQKSSITLTWEPRPEPLRPACVVGTGPAATRLARRLLRLDPATLSTLLGVAGPGLLCLTGREDDLPWADGVRYLGQDPGAPALLLPTTRAPLLHAGLLQRALLARASILGGAPPFAVLLDPPTLIPLGEAKGVARPALRAWLEQEAKRSGGAR